MEVIMIKFNAIRDFLWVLQAFLRGKLLRQKAYCPQGTFFKLSLPFPVTAKRIKTLMSWWGYRMATLTDLYRGTRERHSYSSLVLTPSREELEEWEKHISPDVGIQACH